eukprot:4859106-Pleurochrysis_carterae.AAC.1
MAFTSYGALARSGERLEGGNQTRVLTRTKKHKYMSYVSYVSSPTRCRLAKRMQFRLFLAKAKAARES